MVTMARLACEDPAKFIKLTKTADVKDFSKYVGYDLAAN